MSEPQSFADFALVVIMFTTPPIIGLLPLASRNSAKPIQWVSLILALVLAGCWFPLFAILLRS